MDEIIRLEECLLQGQVAEAASGAEGLLRLHGKSIEKSFLVRVLYVLLQSLFLAERSVPGMDTSCHRSASR